MKAAGAAVPHRDGLGLVAVFGSTFLELVGYFMLSPLLLLRLKDDHISNTLAGLFVATGWMGIFIMTPFASSVAHRLGRRQTLWLAGALLALCAAVFLFSTASRAQVVVIANNSVKSADISKGDLRDVFNGAATSLKDGSHVTPVLLKGGAAHDSFLADYVGKSDTAFRAGWRSLVFSGQASMPKSLDGEAAMVDYVAHTAGAVGYINKATVHEGVKILTVR